MFCSNCGARVPNTAKFCQQCGEDLSRFAGMFRDDPPAPAAPVQKPVLQQPAQQQVYRQPVQPAQQQPVYQQPVQPVQQPVRQQPIQQPVQQPVYQQPAAAFNGYIPFNGMLYDANRMTFRVKCPSCGNVQNAPLNYSCRKCKAQHTAVNPYDGFLYYYRMGNYFSSNVAATVWLNGQEYGGVGNTEGVILPLAPGEYKLQVGIRGVKKSEVIPIRITTGQVFCVKTSLVVHGFSNYTKLFTVDPSEMPNLY